jgi:hypothetical protein
MSDKTNEIVSKGKIMKFIRTTSKTLFLLLLLAVSSQAMAQNALLHELYGSQEEVPTNEDVAGPDLSTKDLGNTSSMEKSVSCSDKDQNSLPLRFVMGLLRQKGAKLKPFHDASTSTLMINGGNMIGNCNSMLEYTISEPGDGLPYVFQVKIKGCGKDECEYNVKTAEDGVPKDIDEPIKVEPNMNGFIKCLELTGVFKDGKIQSSKIALAEFKAVKQGVNQSADLWFASHGPYVDPKNGVFGDGGNKKPGVGCFYFEDIQKDGYKIYSKSDREINRKKDEFQSLCKSKNYKLIDSKIGEFKEIKYLQNILTEVRDQLLLDKVKEVANDINTMKDYSSLDAAEIRQVLEDFDSYIIQPKRDELFGVYSQGKIQKKGLYHRIFDEKDKDKKAELITEFMKKLHELNKYKNKPYLSLKMLENMESFKKQAPIDDEDWYMANLSLNKSMNTILAFSAPYKDMLKRYKTRPNHKFSKFPGISFIKTQKAIDDAQGKYARDLTQKRKLAEDSDYYKSKDLKGQAANLKATNDRNIANLKRGIADVEQEMYEDCCYIRRQGTFDPMCMQKKYYKNHQKCAAELEEDIKFMTEKVKKLNAANDKLAAQLEKEASSWEGVEKKRDKYYTSDDDDDDDDDSDSKTSGYSFTYQNNGNKSSGGNGQIISGMFPQGGAGYPNMMQGMQSRMPGSMGMSPFGMSGMGMGSMGMGMPNYGMGMGMSPMGMGGGYGFNMGGGFGGMGSMGGMSGYGMNGMNYGGMPGAMQYQMSPAFNGMGMAGYGGMGSYTFGM